MVKEQSGEDKLAQIRWKCRRGMLELDLMLQSFFDSSYTKLSPEKQGLFENLLAEADQDLYKWLIGAEVCSQPQFQDMLLVIRHLHARQASQPQNA